VVLPVSAVPQLPSFLERHYPEFFRPERRYKPYFACPPIEPLMHNTARLYGRTESLWIDYGDTRQFHLRTAERQRIFAGPPRSGASVYRAPGRDDITFLVDFSVVRNAAHDAGVHVQYFGGQGELARRSGVKLDRRARDLILRYRTLGWMLAVVGVGPERDWRHTGLTWSKGKGGRMRDDVNKAVAEFVGKRSSNFKLLVLA
ncbi:MAG: SAM-dependent methyltransferase, partial [Gaiellaceae bacterium]